MKPSVKKFVLPLALFVAGNGIIGIAWWVNGAESDDMWLYAMAVFFIFYGSYELYAGLSKHYKDK